MYCLFAHDKYNATPKYFWIKIFGNELEFPNNMNHYHNNEIEYERFQNEMIAKQTMKDATIYVEPTDTAIRIRGKWDNHISFGITKELFEIYDRIAGHIKSV